MHPQDILILKGHEVRSLLDNRGAELLQTVQTAYEAHARGESSLPHASFLSCSSELQNRIIALPACLTGTFDIAGIKWIASFPDNIKKGLNRASAVIILNSPLTGRPEAILEGSVISTKRTAASAVLAAKVLRGDCESSNVGLIGCGVINLEISRFLVSAIQGLKTLTIFDIDAARAVRFKGVLSEEVIGVEISIAKRIIEVIKSARLISIATTANAPHIFTTSEWLPDSLVLHMSLRDLSPEVILSSTNVVDDVDHVCRSRTSIHLAEMNVGNRDFIRCTLSDILMGKVVLERTEKFLTVFSPFGLGILDIAVGKLVRDLAIREGCGTTIDSFLV